MIPWSFYISPKPVSPRSSGRLVCWCCSEVNASSVLHVGWFIHNHIITQRPNSQRASDDLLWRICTLTRSRTHRKTPSLSLVAPCVKNRWLTCFMCGWDVSPLVCLAKCIGKHAHSYWRTIWIVWCGVIVPPFASTSAVSLWFACWCVHVLCTAVLCLQWMLMKIHVLKGFFNGKQNSFKWNKWTKKKKTAHSDIT